MKVVSLLTLALLAQGWLAPLRANVSLPALFSDHAVLQRDKAVPVWGWADPGEVLTVTFAGQTKTATADGTGKWRVELDPLKTGEAAMLTVKGKNTITVQDVLVGEVWLCSGQSNMSFQVQRADAFEAEKAAGDHPQVRIFTVTSRGADSPQEKCDGRWTVATPATVGGLSAIAYFLGRDLNTKLQVPCGMINSSVGGTPVEAWTSIDAQRDLPEAKVILDRWAKRAAEFDPEKAKADNERRKAAYDIAAAKAQAAGKVVGAFRPEVDPRTDAHRPVNLFNGKIAPLIPYAIRGAVWYQGESNGSTVEGGLAYRKQLPVLVEDWRKRWGYDFPFAWVQLPELARGGSEAWCLVREAMLQSLKLPRTGMAIALGLGDVHNVHPTHKQAVAARLAAWALSEVYAQKTPWGGPLYAGNEIHGNKVTVSFTHTDGGLAAEGGALKGFVIAGEDQKWKPAAAAIEGSNVVVSSPEVPAPVAVRYAWADAPEASLFNGAHFPASPFRTDEWPIPDPQPATARK